MSEIIKSELHEPITVNEHLSLRSLAEEDGDELFAAVDSSRAELREFLPWVDSTLSADESRAFIADMLKKRSEGEEFGYGIIVDGKVAGHISLMKPKPGESAEVGYWVATEVASKGITTEATKAITEFGLDKVGLKYLTLRTDERNAASQRVAEKAGFVKVGEHKDSDRYGGVTRTVFDYEFRRNDQTAAS